jgi:hypothetical protein
MRFRLNIFWCCQFSKFLLHTLLCSGIGFINMLYFFWKCFLKLFKFINNFLFLLLFFEVLLLVFVFFVIIGRSECNYCNSKVSSHPIIKIFTEKWFLFFLWLKRWLAYCLALLLGIFIYIFWTYWLTELLWHRLCWTSVYCFWYRGFCFSSKNVS